MAITDTLTNALKQHFGFNEFRPHQQEIVEKAMANEDVLAILPTGSGKSLCYQLPAILSEGTALIVSPLIALMQDQVQQLNELGISATMLNSTLSVGEKSQVMQNFNDYRCVYVSPERALDEGFLSFLSTVNISFFVIDEAHCISQWGHSFRPEYRQLATLRELFPDKHIMALTATATPDVQLDIMKALRFSKNNLVLGSFERDNLHLKIQPRISGSQQILEFCKTRKDQSGIIYASTRKKVETICQQLQSHGFSACKYHAGLPDDERASTQKAFIHDDIQIIVATVAFGMGINKSNVRFVLHYDLPKNMEQYYQEIGRAGRDGLPSNCMLLYSQGDIIIQKRFIDDIQDQAVVHHLKRKAEQFLTFCNSGSCRTKAILQYFGETYPKENCGHCDNCTEDVISIDGTEIAQKILSGVYRVNQRFGMNYVVDTLIGSKNKKIQQFGHSHLSTYGILSDLSRKDIQHYMYALINDGYLFVTEDKFPIVKLTKKSWPISAVKDIRFKQLPPSASKSKKAKKDSLPFSDNPDLYAKLKALRKEIADSLHIPAFMVFHDATLIELSTHAPKNRSELLLINGVGPKKAQQYGDDILACIQAAN